jgi:hypothetical protein
MNSAFLKCFFILFSFFFILIQETLSIQLTTNCTSQGNKYYDTFIYECVDCYANSESTGKSLLNQVTDVNVKEATIDTLILIQKFIVVSYVLL